jgi:hypothetical protein
VQNVLPILQHLYMAHQERSPGQQVQDALALDAYIKTHTVWVESILKPAVSDGGSVLDDTLGVLLNPDSYVATHTVWAGQMLTPTTDFLTNNC